VAFDWAEYRRLANELKTRTDDEAALRSAISRLYYSAFHPAKTHLKKLASKYLSMKAAHIRRCGRSLETEDLATVA